jgi:hypothetical protein
VGEVVDGVTEGDRLVDGLFGCQLGDRMNGEVHCGWHLGTQYLAVKS